MLKLDDQGGREFYLDRLNIMVIQVLSLSTHNWQNLRIKVLSQVAAKHWNALKKHCVLLKAAKYQLTFTACSLIDRYPLL